MWRQTLRNKRRFENLGSSFQLCRKRQEKMYSCQNQSFFNNPGLCPICSLKLNYSSKKRQIIKPLKKVKKSKTKDEKDQKEIIKEMEDKNTVVDEPKEIIDWKPVIEKEKTKYYIFLVSGMKRLMNFSTICFCEIFISEISSLNSEV